MIYQKNTGCSGRSATPAAKHEPVIVCLPEPYPPLDCVCENCQTGRCLLAAVSRADGELNEMLRYHYQYRVLKDEIPELASILYSLHEAEEKHHDTITELIEALGADSMYISCGERGTRWWTTRDINYYKDPTNMLLESLRVEEAQIAFYTARIRTIEDAAVNAILEHVRSEEAMHADVLRMCLRRWGRETVHTCTKMQPVTEVHTSYEKDCCAEPKSCCSGCGGLFGR